MMPADKDFETVTTMPKKQPKLDGNTSWLRDDIAELDCELYDVHSGRTKTVVWTTGLSSLDEMLGGFQQGQYYVLAGQTGFGKSSMALTTTLSLALNGEPAPLFVSLEMSKRDMAIRAVAWLTGISQFRLMQVAAGKEKLPEHLRSKASEARGMIQKDVRLMCSGTITPDDVRREAVALQQASGLSIVIVDYLQLMRGSQKSYATREREVAEVSRSLRALSLDLNVPVIALSQLNRQSNGRDEPMLSDLRESGSLEQDASAVLFLARLRDEKKQVMKGRARVIVAKNRFGSTGDKPIAFIGRLGRFAEVADVAGTQLDDMISEEQ